MASRLSFFQIMRQRYGLRLCGETSPSSLAQIRQYFLVRQEEEAALSFLYRTKKARFPGEASLLIQYL